MCAFEEAAVHNVNQVTPRMGNELPIAPEAFASIAHVQVTAIQIINLTPWQATLEVPQPP